MTLTVEDAQHTLENPTASINNDNTDANTSIDVMDASTTLDNPTANR